MNSPEINTPDHEAECLDNLLETLAQVGGPDAQVALGGLKAILKEKNARIAELEKASFSDHLTGLGNVRAFEARKTELESQMDNSHQRKGEPTPVAVVVINADLIGLKRFNENYSPVVGDEAIKIVSQALGDPFREDEWYRRGGDEFVGLVPVYDLADVDEIMRKVCEDSPKSYDTLRHLQPSMPFSETFPVKCATEIYQPGGKFASLTDAELAADPKTAGKGKLVEFRSPIEV